MTRCLLGNVPKSQLRRYLPDILLRLGSLSNLQVSDLPEQAKM